MTISLRQDLEARLTEQARRHGLSPDDYAARLIEQALTQPRPNQATLDLLAKWEAEQATNDPEELARRQQEGEEFMQNLARNRLEMEGPDARKLWP